MGTQPLAGSSEVWRQLERELLALHGLGLTDKVIARQLDLSERTVQRATSALMVRLPAGTRFQAGVRAKNSTGSSRA